MYKILFKMKNIQLYNEDNLEVMKRLPNESIDVICIDPPYLYLKNQKLERPFDEPKFFEECKRLLTKDGFVVMFGRGTSFYRWNTILDDLGFTFKEEIVWNKSHCTSPLMRLSRVHETISIFTKGKGTINKVKVPYLEMKSHDLDSVIGDVKRMKSILKNTKSLDAVLEFLKNNISLNIEGQNPNYLGISSKIKSEDRSVTVLKSVQNGLNEKSIIRTDSEKYKSKSCVATSQNMKNTDRCVDVMSSVEFGLKEKSIIRTDRTDCDTFTKFEVNADKRQTGDRCANAMQSICFGLNEKSIIKQVRDHYSAIHPTQKPVRLIERLLALVIPKDKEAKDIVIADWFGGSFSTMETVYNMGMQGISTEIDKEYFDLGKERIEKLTEGDNQLKMVI